MADAADVEMGVPFDGKQPLTFVVFGATGDLARKKLYPAFNELLRFGRLPDSILVVGYGRSDYTMETLWKKQSVKCKGTEEEKQRLYKQCIYYRGQYNSAEDFTKLDGMILEYANKMGGPDNRIFFLSVPPTIFGAVCKNVKENCMSKKGFTRIIIEKPFGRDSETFQKLNDVTSTVFDERQIYRIDHYLGKEVIMNILCQRFANVIFEAMWNRQYIESVEINWQENLGTGGRGGYFDKFGIIRDIMQNHLLQVLMFITMERPDSLSGEDIVKKKTELLKCIPILKPDDCILGQFTSRIFTNYGKQVIEPGYLDDETVPNDSKCPTYAAVKLDINNDRWQGVPFIVKAGKGLNERLCEVRIHFKAPPGGLYNVPGNELVMRIQPDEAIYFKVQNKRPGLAMSTLDTTVMDMTYSHEFSGVRIADAYERAFLNATRADQSLFVGSSELVEAWRIFTPLLHHIDENKPEPHLYPFGTTGPKEATAFLNKFGITSATTWENLLLSNAKDANQLKQLFDSIAKNNILHNAEVATLLKQFYDGRDVPEKRIEQFMKELDMNNDGEVSWEEFQQGVAGLLAVDKSMSDDVGVPKHSDF